MSARSDTTLLGACADLESPIPRAVLDTTGNILGPAYPFLAVGEDINTGSGSYARDGSLIIYFRLAGQLPSSFLQATLSTDLGVVAVAGGTRRLYLDLVDANIDFTATVPAVTNPMKRHRMARRSTSPSSFSTSTSTPHHAQLGKRANPLKFADVPTLGSIYQTGLAARDYALNFPGFTDYELPFSGDTDRVDASVGVQYRVLLR